MKHALPLSLNQIDVNANAPAELQKLTTILHKEEAYIQQAIQQGKSPKQAYSEIENDLDRQFNCVTGGGCATDTWWLTMGRADQSRCNQLRSFWP